MHEHSILLQSVFRNAERFPGKTAVIIDDKEVTYVELAQNIRKAAWILYNLGLKAGDRIILSAQKEIEYIYLYFGAHVIGVINVIVDATQNEERLRYIENKVNPKYVFGYASDRFSFKMFKDLDIASVDELWEYPVLLNGNDIAEILFTTGTTGAPKGVCLSYNNIFSSALNINGYIQNTERDVELLGLPICHSFGMGRLRCNLLLGATIVILSSFANVKLFLKSVEKYHVTGFGIVPAAWAYIRKMSGTRIAQYACQIKYIEIGSAAMPLEAKKELLAMFPSTRICMHYGLTEASRNCFIEFHDTEHLDSIGKPVCDDVDLKIFDFQGSILPAGTRGELCVKGNIVFRHYLEEADTRIAFWGEYFRTGDYGYINSDGYIYLLGREKEMINVGGKKVSPMEVEDAIIALGVKDCVCVPMEDKQGILGEVVMCYIPRGATTLTFEEIANTLASKLEIYKRPVAYDWIDKIPMTPSGKKQRLKIK